LQTATKKLKANNLFDSYNDIFKQWRKEGIIQVVSAAHHEFHYLPHRPVVKGANLTTKIRPVFDASASNAGSPSLDYCLEEGSNLIELIPAVLLRFRDRIVAVTDDIRKKFLQISVNLVESDYLRYL
jgi:hypothetical protein